MNLVNVIEEFPADLQTPVLHLATVLREDMGVSHEDFSELKDVVRELADAQRRTENRVEELAGAQRELTDAQKRTENSVEELADAQKRTENRVEELADAQKRTENRVEELTDAIQKGFKTLNDTVAALGGRWGIRNEATIRNILQGVLGKTDYSVKRGCFGGREVDIVIRGDNTHILLEITSSLRPADILKYVASADDYQTQTGVSPIIMVATPHIRPKVIKAINASPRPIELYSDEDEEEVETEL